MTIQREFAHYPPWAKTQWDNLKGSSGKNWATSSPQAFPTQRFSYAMTLCHFLEVGFVCLFHESPEKELKKKGLFCNSPPSSSSVARNKEMKRYNDFTVRVFGSAPMNWSLVITGAAFLEKDVFSTSVSRLTENRSFPSQESLRNLLWFTCDTVFFKLVAAVNVWRNKGH